VRLCPDLVFIRPDFGRYRREAEAIFAIYREVTPLVEPMSLDEAYLDVTEHLAGFGSATAIARHLRTRVRAERRLTVSVGVAPNKLLAKIASDFDKPDGLTVVKPGQVPDFLAPLAVERLHGIGPATARALADLGVATVADLRALSLDRLLARFGHWGRTLHEHARGVDHRPVSTDHVRRALSTEETFRRDLTELEAMDRVLDAMAAEISAGLRRRRLLACTVTVKVRYSDFRTVTRSRTFALPFADEPAIAACARELVRRTEAGEQPVRLLGVGASSLVPGEAEQMDLFGELSAVSRQLPASPAHPTGTPPDAQDSLEKAPHERG
jgi:DNA polymerase-4